MDRRFEAAMGDLFWVPHDVVVVDRSDVLYTFGRRPVEAHHQVLRVRASADAVPALVAEVDRVHGTKPSRWQLADPSWQPSFARHLDAHGWRSRRDYRLRVTGVGRRIPVSRDVDAVVVHDRATFDAFLTVARAAFPPGPTLSEDDLVQQLADCTAPGARIRRVVAFHRATGAPVSAGAVTVCPEPGVGLLWGGGTVPEARGRGAYRAVLATRLAVAQAAGCTHVGLYANPETSEPIVAALGFDAFGLLRVWDRAGEG
ncbi:MAG: hypothetical protein H6733_13625 [Alphaproteobacteria bacterium]|nr:hypothetical protein [Alphaproteobacteria bacterium]